MVMNIINGILDGTFRAYLAPEKQTRGRGTPKIACAECMRMSNVSVIKGLINLIKYLLMLLC